MRQATLQCPAAVDPMQLADALIEAGASFVSVSDGAANTAAESPVFATFPVGATEPRLVDAAGTAAIWSKSTLEVGFDAATDIESTLLLASGLARLAALPRYWVADVESKDWVADVQSGWPPIVLRDCLTIRFPWHTADDVARAEGTAEPLITVNPGCAFGTGEHATTQLCVRRLAQLLKHHSESESAPPAVLDYGAGSGVLGLASLLFGAERAVGVEIDEQALALAQANAVENGLDGRFSVLRPEEEEAHAEEYPLVVANILASTLVELAPTLLARVAPGGTLLLSGILGEAQADEVRGAFSLFSACGFGGRAWHVQADASGWILLEVSKPMPEE